MVIHQVTGFSGSGKTTVVTELLKAAGIRGIKAATIKHHGGGSPLATEPERKDTSKHREAGACATLAAAENEFIWTVQTGACWKLDDYIQLYEQLPIDLLLVEGFKKAAFPKTVIVCSEKDLELLQKSENIKAVLTNEAVLLKTIEDEYDGQVFSLNELHLYVNWFYSTFI